jgi:hypothetical protein
MGPCVISMAPPITSGVAPVRAINQSHSSSIPGPASLSITRLAAKIVAALLARTSSLGLLGLIFSFFIPVYLFIFWDFLTNWIRLGVAFAYGGTIPFNLWDFIDKALHNVIYATQVFIINPKNMAMWAITVKEDTGFPQLFMLHLSAYTNVLPSFIRFAIMTYLFCHFFLSRFRTRS